MYCQKNNNNERKGREERILAIGSVATSGHIWSTSSSPFYIYYIPFRSSRSQKSKASNGFQTRVETKKLRSLQENWAELKENFANLNPRCENFRTVRNTLLAFRTTQTNFCTVRIKVRNSIQHAKITVQGANSLNVSFAHHYSRCETPFWHTSAITLSIEMVSHRVKQGAKISHSVKLSAKLDSWCETTCKIFFFNESTSKSGETCETTSEKVNQLVKIHPSFENPKSNFAWLLFKMRKISHSAKPPAATRVSSPQVAKRFCTVRNKVRKILHYANSSAKIKTWCENFAP